MSSFDWRCIWRINSPIDVSLDWNLALSLAYIYILISPPVFRRWRGKSQLGGWFWPLSEECAATSLPYFLSFYLEFMWLPVLAQFGKLAPRMVASAKDGKDGMRNRLVNLKIALSIPHFAACNHRGLVWKKGRWGSSCCLDCLFECGGDTVKPRRRKTMNSSIQLWVSGQCRLQQWQLASVMRL